ncbi:MAG TPA: sulfatase [Vicinamibacteria bacterium]|nr:sulfatase [Vicinamibacteria bacterium]
MGPVSGQGIPRVPLAVLAAGIAALAQCSRGAPARPNVVLVILDTLRADALGCYNDAYPDLSPEIDALARQGARFLDVTAQSSWTRPSVGSLLTSVYPRTLGIHGERWDVLPDGFVTLAEALRAAGYETVGVTANPNLNEVFNFHQGFDTYVESAVVWDWMRPAPGQKQGGRKQTLPDSERILERMLDHARSRTSRRPLYMQIVLMEVHEGWKLVRPEFRTNYRGLVGAPKGYWDGVRQVSFDLGRFVERLVALPGWRNTLFVITSDHGQGLGDHPAVTRSWGHGLLLYGSQVKVPLILYDPAAAAGRFSREGTPHSLRPQEVEGRVRLLDVMPTILDYVGVPAPPDVDGRSLTPLLTGARKAPDLPPYDVTETYYDGSDKRAVHSRSWTYIENRDGHEGVNARELQRAGASENGRLTDRIDEHPAVARELADYLRAWERRFPRRPATQPARGPSQDVVDQLKALGYIK